MTTLSEAYNYLRYPIVCAGMCFTTTDSENLEGWTFTNDARFSSDGKHVWVCPKCSQGLPPAMIRLVYRYGVLQADDGR